MITETSREYFSISSFGRKHEASFTKFWFCTNCTNFVWLTGTIFQNTPWPGSLKFLSLFRQNFHLNPLRYRCKNSKRFLNFRPPKLPRQSSADCYKTLELTSESEYEFFFAKHRDFIVYLSSRISSTTKPKLQLKSLDISKQLNCRIPCHLFASHWIRIASIVFCFVLQRTPTNENNSGTEWQVILNKDLQFKEGLCEFFRGNSSIISDCRVWSILKTLPGCRVSRHCHQNSVQYVLMFVIYPQPHRTNSNIRLLIQ